MNNPSHLLSRSSHFLRKEGQSRPGTSRPGDGYTQEQQAYSIDEANHAERLTSPTHDGTSDPMSEKHDDKTDQHSSNPPLQPFFTLIEDAHTADYHHPNVHYIFSDDDTDIVTEAALRSLEQQETQPRAMKDQPPIQDENEGKSTFLPPPIPGVGENYIVLDVEPLSTDPPPTNPAPDPSTTKPSNRGAGFPPATQPTVTQSIPVPVPGSSATAAPVPAQFRVTSAKSFSPTWQVLSSEMVPAPTFENGNPGETTGHGLMLKIHGTGGLPGEVGMGREREKDKQRGAQRLEEMMDQFAKRMRELQMVIDTAYMEGAEGGLEEQAVEGGKEQAVDVSGEGFKEEGDSGEQMLGREHS